MQKITLSLIFLATFSLSFGASEAPPAVETPSIGDDASGIKSNTKISSFSEAKKLLVERVLVEPDQGNAGVQTLMATGEVEEDLLEEESIPGPNPVPGPMNGIYCGCEYKKELVEYKYEVEKAKALESHKIYNWDSEEGFKFQSKEEFEKYHAENPRYKLTPLLEPCGYKPKGMAGEHSAWNGSMLFQHPCSDIAFPSGRVVILIVFEAKEMRKCKRLTEEDNEEMACGKSEKDCVVKTVGDISCKTYHRPKKAYKGRRCVTKVSSEYKLMQADMHNLYPAIGEVNGLRSNKPMAEIEGEERIFGTCDAEIKDGLFEPREQVRGDIARTHFYMKDAYPERMHFSEEFEAMMQRWDAMDPVDDWECERDRRIEKIQQNFNRFVREPCEQTQTRKKRKKNIFHKIFSK